MTTSLHVRDSIEQRINSVWNGMLETVLMGLDQAPFTLQPNSHKTVLTAASVSSGESNKLADKTVERYERRFGPHSPKSTVQLVAQCLEVASREARNRINEALPERLQKDVATFRRQKAHAVSSGMSF